MPIRFSRKRGSFIWNIKRIFENQDILSEATGKYFIYANGSCKFRRKCDLLKSFSTVALITFSDTEKNLRPLYITIQSISNNQNGRNMILRNLTLFSPMETTTYSLS